MIRVAFAVLLIAAPLAAQVPDSGAFVTRLGVDTIAVERFARTADGVRAEVMLRSPETTLRAYELRTGAAPVLVVESYDPRTGFAGEPTDRREIELSATSPIPFIDMVHWPFELMTLEARRSGADSTLFALATSRRPLPFVVRRTGAARYTATHPTRGTMTLTVDDAGRLVELDASRTTRALRVTRVPTVDVAALAARFADRPAGELSGRGSAEASVGGADIAVDYGVPLKRGRDIFGALVPYGRVWRTGANRATHFATTRDLRAGDVVIPAGSYTLFTIPGPETWTLLVNRRTDINGQDYEATADLARIEMRTRALAEVVEPFTILITEEPDGSGTLRLRWDRTEAYLPFTVR